MRLPHTTRRGRHGFTLVELVVVIAIILILATLLTSALFKAFGQRKAVQARTEMTQLTAAVDNFKRQYKVNYMPSMFMLCENCNDYYTVGPSGPVPINQLAADSLEFLKRMFPRADFSFVPAPGTNWNQYDWNGDGGLPPRPGVATPWILEGDQCLVFFLGGIPLPGPGGFNCQGFSTKPSNPAPLNGPQSTGTGVIPPFYSFQFPRLQLLPHAQVAANAAPFPSYTDPWGNAPYLYFTSFNGANNYNRYAISLGTSDCPSAPIFPPASGMGVWPYAQVQQNLNTLQYQWNYYRPESFQIVCAGPDGVFGPGSNPGTPNAASWTPGTAGAFYPTPAPGTPAGGYDDLSNFYGLSLGAASGG
jgi:prepilin-type N-terminal cleavage/methylation domain-containing protein